MLRGVIAPGLSAALEAHCAGLCALLFVGRTDGRVEIRQGVDQPLSAVLEAGVWRLLCCHLPHLTDVIAGDTLAVGEVSGLDAVAVAPGRLLECDVDGRSLGEIDQQRSRLEQAVAG